MKLPARLTLRNFLYLLDGGTTILEVVDDEGQQRTVLLGQHAFPRITGVDDPIPGRLYFDGRLIAQRSQREHEVLRLLKTARVELPPAVKSSTSRDQSLRPALVLGDDLKQLRSQTPEENIRSVVGWLVKFVESDDYLRFAVTMEQAADATPYTVWIHRDPTQQTRTVFRFGQLNGISVSAAREILDRKEPIAKDIPALQVAELAKKYYAAGLTFDVVPSFPWPLP